MAHIRRLLVEREARRLNARMKLAALMQATRTEVIDLRIPRCIHRVILAQLISGGRIDRNENLLIAGPTGQGKSRSGSRVR